MAHRLIVPPANPVITLAEAKAHLRVDTSDDDSYIATIVDVATQIVDGREERNALSLMPQTWQLTLDAFPLDEIFLPRHPVMSIDGVTYDAEDGFPAEVPASYYSFDPEGWVVLNTGFDWPLTLDAINAVRVTYVAGHASTAIIPAPLKHAILLLVGHYYQFREQVVTGAQYAPHELPQGVHYLLAPYRDWYV